MNATVFYAWQSDRPRRTNQDLIRKAAEAACKRISEDDSNSWTLTLDSDTQGVAGMCDIPNAILEKIKNCSMILADLTFVGRTDDDSDGQQMPNSNVLFELGFSASCLGFDSLIGVVNEAYGNIDGQVFDVKRRRSLRYSVPKDADSATIAKQQERLSGQLEKVFRTTLDTVVAPHLAAAGRDREEKFRGLQADFARRVKERRFNNYSGLPATLLTIQSSVVDELEYDDLYDQVRETGRNAQPSENAMHWNDGCQTAELGTNGLLLHAYGGVYESTIQAHKFGASQHARLHSDEPAPSFVYATLLQKRIVSHAFAQCQLLETLQLPLPWLVGVSLVGAEGFSLVTDSEKSPNTIDADELHFGPCVIESSPQFEDYRAIGNCLRDSLNRLCRRVGWEGSECFTSGGEWNMRIVGNM